MKRSAFIKLLAVVIVLIVPKLVQVKIDVSIQLPSFDEGAPHRQLFAPSGSNNPTVPR